MSTYVNNNVASGNIVYASDHNTQGALVAAVLNGGIDDANIAFGAAIAGSKIATDSVTDTQLDFPRWYPEIGRTILSVAGTSITVSGLPARKYLRIIMYLIDSAAANQASLRFNADSGNNYAFRVSTNGAADTTGTSQSSIPVDAGGNTAPCLIVVDVINVAAREKIVRGSSVDRGTAGAGNAPNKRDGMGKWANTADLISTVSVTSANNYAIGSEVVVLGHD